MRLLGVLCVSLFSLALAGMAPNSVGAQDRLAGPQRRVVRLNVGVPGDRVLGVDADFGLTARTSTVVSARLWKMGSWACAGSGPILRPDGTYLPEPDSRPCIPDGWSLSAGLRGGLSWFFTEIDLGLYRYERGQALMVPYGGLRVGLAPVVSSRVELQVALHLIVVSSFNGSGFDPNSWFLGAWDVGLGVPIG